MCSNILDFSAARDLIGQPLRAAELRQNPLLAATNREHWATGKVVVLLKKQLYRCYAEGSIVASKLLHFGDCCTSVTRSRSSVVSRLMHSEPSLCLCTFSASCTDSPMWSRDKPQKNCNQACDTMHFPINTGQSSRKTSHLSKYATMD